MIDSGLVTCPESYITKYTTYTEINCFWLLESRSARASEAAVYYALHYIPAFTLFRLTFYSIVHCACARRLEVRACSLNGERFTDTRFVYDCRVWLSHHQRDWYVIAEQSAPCTSRSHYQPTPACAGELESRAAKASEALVR